MPDLKVRRSVVHFPVLALPFVGERLVRQLVPCVFPVENRVTGVFATCFSPTRHACTPDRFAFEVEALRRRDALSYDAASLVGAARTLGHRDAPAVTVLAVAGGRTGDGGRPSSCSAAMTSWCTRGWRTGRPRVFRDAPRAGPPGNGASRADGVARPCRGPVSVRWLRRRGPAARTRGIPAVVTRLMLDEPEHSHPGLAGRI